MTENELKKEAGLSYSSRRFLNKHSLKNYLIYHPKRQPSVINGLKIYHDKFGGNEDPFLWNVKFLHSFCKITGIKKEPFQINFWVSGDPGRNFDKLLCDCVFVISEICQWSKPNKIRRNNKIVDSDVAYDYHYKWVHQHPFKKRVRYTLKADSDKSFQPQTKEKELFDILPFLKENGMTTECLRKSFFPRFTWRSKFYEIDQELGKKLYEHIFNESSIKLFGSDLENIHPKNKKTDYENCKH